MADRDRWEEPEPDADDWFAGADPSGFEAGAPGAAEGQEGETGGDDWLAEVGKPRRSSRHHPRLRGAPAKLGLAAAALVVVLLGSLAAAGVFTGARTTPKAVTTTPPPPTIPTTTPSPTTTAVGALPTSTLKPGDTGPQVVDLQRALARLGYAPGRADGGYGPATQRAVERFQRASGLTADGILGPKTLAALERAAAAG